MSSSEQRCGLGGGKARRRGTGESRVPRGESPWSRPGAACRQLPLARRLAVVSTPEARGGDRGEFWSLPGSWVKHPTVRVPGAAAPVAKVTWDDRVLLSVSLTGGGASAPARAGGVCGSPGLSPQWTLTVSEQIQKPRALLLALQLPVLQVVRLLLQVAVPLLLPLPLPLQVQVLLPRKEAPVAVQEPHPAVRFLS